MAFDDDETPLVSGPAPAPAGKDDDGAVMEDALEDGMPDYKLFASMFEKKGVSGKSIRKGEKDFESHGTRAQDNALESSRKAMEEVLGYTRTHRADAWSRGWFFPDWWAQQSADDSRDAWLRHRVVVVEHEKGSWMKDIGRTVPGTKQDQPGVGRLWLLPEEALYLVERGTLDFWWPDVQLQDLEAAYALLVGLDGEQGKTSLPKYQVFAHLKRAGFHVMRAPPESRPAQESPPSPATLWQWLFSLVSWERRPKQNPLGPLVSSGIYRAYGPIYQQLAMLPRHRPMAVPPAASDAPQEPFRVNFHVWKPGGAPFSKKNPPPPHFRIAVADTSNSEVPTLEQMEALLESTPLDPPGEGLQGPGRLYQRIKHGHRNVLVAVVDRGLVNFMRFGEAVFGDEKLYERFDKRGGGGRGVEMKR
ncbi:tRNA-splicing endonuclease subunit sen54 n-term domain-containing protein [Hirsutella rhossiliensis]|uniref:tRNA-splicing endonuclease subunit sen54 n-term domain-containing protein n=1 Tax=Hirsutella rhossiliensis TaxID=111463 RepID=A0A9P8SM19_9HYPO|nr:tRNA-splicing endonuclease subunit sen54 n-term domain-containing protein [Hirsutella rhossiliensis]KAH0966874.1 tRNA-splicing endonuclease subunit sen54 n-term domain-containing protein [Hirsutella rhossiliensis]